MKINKYPIPTKCPYCGSKVIYTSNAKIYGKEYGNGKCYKCINCDAYVGVHTGTDIPLGRIANKELRQLKKQCHDLFDRTWTKEKHNRQQKYKELANYLKIPQQECHFGWFDKEMLIKSLEYLKRNEEYYV